MINKNLNELVKMQEKCWDGIAKDTYELNLKEIEKKEL